MLEGIKIGDFCYEFDNGQFYTIFYLYGWAAVMMHGDGMGYTLSFAEH